MSHRRMNMVGSFALIDIGGMDWQYTHGSVDYGRGCYHASSSHPGGYLVRGMHATIADVICVGFCAILPYIPRPARSDVGL